MPTVFTAMSISLDGYTAGPNDGPAHPLGVGGERLHAWMDAAPGSVDAQLVREPFERAGAVVIGRRMFDLGRAVWGGNPFQSLPLFVVSSRPPDLDDEGWATLVHDGHAAAVARARAAAGDRDVWVVGGAHLVRRCLRDCLLDDLGLTLVPILLGSGTRLLDGIPPDSLTPTPTRLLVGATVSHHRYSVRYDDPVLSSV